MSKTAITIREIIRNTLQDASDEDVCVDLCIQKVKQKLAHLRRVIYQELEIKRLIQPYDSIPGAETMSIQKPLSTDEILDIVYNELDHAIEGLDYDKKDLTDMSRKE